MFHPFRRYMPAVVVFGIALSALPTAAQTTVSSLKPQVIAANVNYIQQAYEYQNNGYQMLDVNQIYALSTADYHLFETTGVTTTRNPLIRRTYNFLLSVAKVNGSLTRTVHIDRIDLTAKRAVVSQTTKLWESVPNPDPTITTTTTKGFGPSVYQDTWVPTTTGWALQSSVQIK